MKKILNGMVAMAVVVASSLAYSTPGVNGVLVEHFKTTSKYANGSVCDDSGYICSFFAAQSYDDDFGLQGWLYAETFDYNTYQSLAYINCFGPAFANAVSVNKNNGETSVNATLDPSDTTNCISYNVSEPVTIELEGQYDGSYKSSENGNGKSTDDLGSYKYNFQYDLFYERFTGTNGIYNGIFNGYASMGHYTNLQKAK